MNVLTSKQTFFLKESHRCLYTDKEGEQQRELHQANRFLRIHCRLENLDPSPAGKAGLSWMEGCCSHERASLGVAGTSLLRALTYPARGCARSLYLFVFTEAQTQQSAQETG